MRARLSSTHLVGRVRELAALELAWREAQEGRPGLVLLGGESGIGKSRLLGELEQRVQAEGGLVLHGESLDQGEGELPFAPVLGALRGLVRDRHPSLDRLSQGSRRALAGLLPGLGDGSEAPAEFREGTGQLRLFEALVELIDLVSDERPVLLVLEDVHWADRSTRTFVSFLVRSLRSEPALVLLSYRTDELHRRHPLRPLIAELERLDRSRLVTLEPLDRDELAEALADILGAPAQPELVSRLLMRSEGNPLFFEELLASGLDGRGPAPQSLRDAFMLRIERLSPSAQAAVRTIAAGRRLREGEIAEVTGQLPTEVQAALREAVAEHVLTADPDGRLGFRHELLREVVLHDLLPGERAELHAALARMLAAADSQDPAQRAELAATVAGHWAAAGDQPAALQASVDAARTAVAVHAYGTAADMAENALALWPRVADASEHAGLDHADLLILAADAHAFGGDRTRVEALLRQALDELGESADPVRRVRLLHRLARVQWSLNRGLQGIETAQQALAILPPGEALAERAMLLAWLARTRVLRGRVRDALGDAEAALRAARAAGDRCAEAEVLETLGMARLHLGREQEGIDCLRTAIEISKEEDDLQTLGYAYSNLGDMLNLRGRTAEALEAAREGLVALPRWMSRERDWLMLSLSELEFERGDWAAAREHLGPHPSRLVGTSLIFRLLREADLAVGEGDEQRAGELLEALAPLVAESSEPQWIGLAGSLGGELLRLRRDLEGARETVGRALDRLEVCTDDVMRIARLSAVGLRVEADFAQRARDLREPAMEREALERTRLHMDRLAAAAQEGGPVEAAWKLTGEAEVLRARGEQEVRAWDAAAAAWEALERPLYAAQARFRGAEAAVEDEDRELATALAGRALATADSLGARELVAEVRRLGERARLDLEAEPEPAEPTDEEEDPFGLTPRERQVLSLIAEGATNRQIGAALYMAEKTASVHVSRILAKLGVSSRTQAAALAHRQQLT